MIVQHDQCMDFAVCGTGERWQQQDVVVAEALEVKVPADAAVAQPAPVVGSFAAPSHLFFAYDAVSALCL